MKEMIYLDNAGNHKDATGSGGCHAAIFYGIYGNASAVYEFGQKARRPWKAIRETIWETFTSDARQYYF